MKRWGLHVETLFLLFRVSGGRWVRRGSSASAPNYSPPIVEGAKTAQNSPRLRAV